MNIEFEAFRARYMHIGRRLNTFETDTERDVHIEDGNNVRVKTFEKIPVKDTMN